MMTRIPACLVFTALVIACAVQAQTQVNVDSVAGQMGLNTANVPRPAVSVPGITQDGPADLNALTGSEDLVFIESLVVEVDYEEGSSTGVLHDYLQKTKANPNPSNTTVRNAPADPGNYTGVIEGEQGDLRNAQARFPVLPNDFGEGMELNTRVDVDRGILYSTLQAMVADGRARILAKPSITTISGFTAKIMTGEVLPFLASTTNWVGQTSTVTEFKNVGLELSVTPNVIYVANEGRTDMILLKVTPRDSTVTRYRMEGEYPVPIIDIRKQDTEVVVRSGETFMMSGLLRTRLASFQRGLPVLSDIPVIDVLASRKEGTDLTTELVVTVTPTIVESRLLDLAENIDAAKEELEKKVRSLDPTQSGVRSEIHERADAAEKVATQ